MRKAPNFYTTPTLCTRVESASRGPRVARVAGRGSGPRVGLRCRGEAWQGDTRKVLLRFAKLLPHQKRDKRYGFTVDMWAALW